MLTILSLPPVVRKPYFSRLWLVCDPGDEIIVPEPAYANYMAFAISCGAVIKTIPSTIDEGFALPSVERFEELITPRTKSDPDL